MTAGLKSLSDAIVALGVILGATGAIAAIGWNYVGKPWAQELIVDTVNERLSVLEQTQKKIVTDLGAIVRQQAAERAQSRGEASALRELGQGEYGDFLFIPGMGWFAQAPGTFS